MADALIDIIVSPDPDVRNRALETAVAGMSRVSGIYGLRNSRTCDVLRPQSVKELFLIFEEFDAERSM